MDYALFIGLQLVLVIEAKTEHKDIPSVLDYQGRDNPLCIISEDTPYQIGAWGEYMVPFTFATNGRPYLEQYRTKSWYLALGFTKSGQHAQGPAGLDQPRGTAGTAGKGY